MNRYHISQFGKPTTRYSFKDAMKVMHDRRLIRRSAGLLRVHCDNIEEAHKIISDKLYNPKCTHVFAMYQGYKLYWFGDYWVDSNRFFSDEFWDLVSESASDDFFKQINERENKLNTILK